MHYSEWRYFQPKQKQKISLFCNWAHVLKKCHNENNDIRVIFLSQVVVSLKSIETATYKWVQNTCMTSIVIK